MKPGKAVTYCNAGSGCVPATVAAVVGAGASGCKRLDLTLTDALSALDVAHQGDAEPGASYWMLLDESQHASEPGLMTGEPTAQPITDDTHLESESHESHE